MSSWYDDFILWSELHTSYELSSFSKGIYEILFNFNVAWKKIHLYSIIFIV